MRPLFRGTLVAGLTGTLMVGAAWAGVGLAPVPVPAPSGLPAPVASLLADEGSPSDTATVATQAAATLPGLAGGQVFAGAAKRSIAPRPQDMQKDFPGARWETDPVTCTTLSESALTSLPDSALQATDGLAGPGGSPWPENPDCIYKGGYGLGPMNPIKAYDTQNGLWVRSFAIGDGKDLVVITVIDGVGWLWDYKNKCTRCGSKQLSEDLAAEPALKARGMTPASFNLHATHSHTAPDFMGGWGFVPDWYMAQVTETIKATVRDAVLSAEAATLEVGVVDARKHNSERRGTYRSAEESQMTWLRAVAAPSGKGKKAAPRVIGTLGAFAAHPVTADAESGVANADWPGYFAQRAEERFGGVGMHVMTGLGNVTGARSEQRDAAGRVTRESTGTALANLIAPVGQGRPVDSPDVRVARATFQQPVTNAPLDALGTPGFFDRRFDPLPAAVSVGKSSNAPCTSAAPQSVELPVNVMRIGDDVLMTTGPGELFSNGTNTIKEKAPDQVVFPFAQTNDSLGYMPQSFELNPVGQQGLGFVAGGYVFVNYEDSYAIDKCVGDMVLEETLKLMSATK